MSEQTEILFAPLVGLAWILSLPIRMLAWGIAKVRTQTYNPEKAICPACGFKGDHGGNSCIIRFTRTKEYKGAIEHDCLRCGALYYSKLFLAAEKWISPLQASQVAKIQEATEKQVI